jgi:hypothetical protein
MKRFALVLALVGSAILGSAAPVAAAPPSWSHSHRLACHAPTHGHHCPVYSAPTDLSGPARR